MFKIVTRCKFPHLIARITSSMSSWRNVEECCDSVEVHGDQEVGQHRLGPQWNFMCIENAKSNGWSKKIANAKQPHSPTILAHVGPKLDFVLLQCKQFIYKLE